VHSPTYWRFTYILLVIIGLYEVNQVANEHLESVIHLGLLCRMVQEGERDQKIFFEAASNTYQAIPTKKILLETLKLIFLSNK